MTVKQKQWQLFFLGFLEREDQLDGIWGAVSAKATVSFQREFGILEDGVFGPDTQAKSREVVEGIQEAVAAFGEGELVRDGLAGPKTMETAAKCQNALGLAPTGIADKKTRQRIAALSGSGREEKDQEEAWWQEIRYFTPEEFRCRCGEYCDGAPARMREDAVRIAEAARRHFGRPGIVVSGLRCRQHNANAGGVICMGRRWICGSRGSPGTRCWDFSAVRKVSGMLT